MEASILKATKKLLQIGLDDDSFDLDVLTHINSGFSRLWDIGVGPPDGFIVEDDAPTWNDFLPITTADDRSKIKQSRVKAIIFLHTRLLFDPPGTSFLLEAMQAQLDQAIWLLSTIREEQDWEDPRPTPEVMVIDGNGSIYVDGNLDGGV